jgi:hypothetical protein
MYREITPAPNGGIHRRTFRAPWLRSFPAEHIHRIVMVRGWLGEIHDCWTLVVVLKPVRSWGFYHIGKFIGWRDYVNSETADIMKACE